MPERNESLRQANIGIAAEAFRIGLQGELLGNKFVRHFGDLADKEHELNLHVYLSGIEDFVSSELTLPDIGYPLVLINDFRRGHTGGSSELVTSPYGPMPNIVIAANLLYFLSNDYIFSLDGQAHKLEHVQKAYPKDNLEKALDDWGLKNQRVRHVEFPLREADSRAVDLSPADYERVATLLAKIRNDELQDTSQKT